MSSETKLVELADVGPEQKDHAKRGKIIVGWGTAAFVSPHGAAVIVAASAEDAAEIGEELTGKTFDPKKCKRVYVIPESSGLNPEAVPGLVEACKSVIREAEHSGGWQEEHHKSFHNVAITLTVEEVRAIAAALSAATKGQP